MNSDMRARADGPELDRSDTDRRALDLIRVLAAVEQAGRSEVLIAPAARQLHGGGVAARVASMPCLEWLTEQDDPRSEHVLPASVHARGSIGAGLTLGWRATMNTAGGRS